jgi:hypothetical protein
MQFAVGISPVENLLKDVSVKLQHQRLNQKSKLYLIGVGRFALILEKRGPDLEQLMDDLDQVLKEPVASGELLIVLEALVGIVEVTLELN